MAGALLDTWILVLSALKLMLALPNVLVAKSLLVQVAEVLVWKKYGTIRVGV
jgi:hypothetical protein